MGKTTFLNTLSNAYRCTWYNTAELYQTAYQDSQFILIDEYTTAHLKATTLNQMCDGTYQYPAKGQGAKAIPAIIIICGNKHP